MAVTLLQNARKHFPSCRWASPMAVWIHRINYRSTWPAIVWRPQFVRVRFNSNARRRWFRPVSSSAAGRPCAAAPAGVVTMHRRGCWSSRGTSCAQVHRAAMSGAEPVNQSDSRQRQVLVWLASPCVSATRDAAPAQSNSTIYYLDTNASSQGRPSPSAQENNLQNLQPKSHQALPLHSPSVLSSLLQSFLSSLPPPKAARVWWDCKLSQRSAASPNKNVAWAVQSLHQFAAK